jgi:alpha-mannosidase
VWRGELYFETHRGTLTSQLETKLGNRRCERLLVEAELWAATLGRSAEVDHLWKEVLTQQFHDILPGSSIAWAHADAEAVFAEVGAELDGRIAALLADIAGPGRSLANPADAAIDEVVVIDAGTLDISVSGEHVQTLADGRGAARVSLPALGVAPFQPLPVADRVVLSDSSMTNGHLAVRWDASGNITSIIDLRSARELVPTGAVMAVLELAVDQPVEYDAWDLESWTRSGGVPITVADRVDIVDAGPLVARVRVTRTFGPSNAAVTYELRADSAQLLVHVEFDWHHDEHLLSMAFPLDVRSDVAMCDIQFGVVARPTHPSSPWDAAKFEVCAHRFVDIAEPDFGVAILNTGRYGHGVFDGAVRVSLAKAATYPDPNADRGHHEVTLAIRPHGRGSSGLAEVRDAAARLNAPLRLVSDGGAMSPIAPIVSVTGVDGDRAAGVEVDAVKIADDDSGDLIVRLHEAVGNRTRISVATPDRITDAWRCNLLEEPDNGEEVGDGVVTLTLRPFQIVTLRLRRSSTDDGRTR